MKQLRDYQIDIANRAVSILKSKLMVYISMEVRTGKTLTALETAKLYGANKVLFLTKKKAISSIIGDYEDFGYTFELTVINDESMHKIEYPDKYDLIIHDEHHRCILGDTLIGDVKIKDIDVGSYQKSFNFVKGIYEYKKVLNKFKNPLKENLVKIRCNGKEIVCTESHKIFTKRGWVEARNILPEDELQMV
jgi:hypothetical protein